MSGSPIVSCLCYRDAAAAVDWLCRAFGFARHAVYEQDGTVVHAELAFGNGMIMLGPVHGGEFAPYRIQPDQTGGRGTQSVYLIVADADAHHDRAVAEGAEILLPLKDAGYGGRGYSCRDPEGHVWSFGTYDPWAAGSGDGPSPA